MKKRKPKKRDLGRVWLWRPAFGRIEAIGDEVYITETMKLRLEEIPHFLPWCEGEITLLEDVETKTKKRRKNLQNSA